MSGGTIARETPRSSLTLLQLYAQHPDAFWRHDVDLSLEAAVRMARVGQTAGVEATFYLNPRSEFYNVFSTAGQAAIAAIRDAGHTIGLHCDTRRPGTCEDAVADDMRLFYAGEVVFSDPYPVSFHMPDPSVLWRDFDWFDNAYASRWEGCYYADSRGRMPNLSDAEGVVQINLHPEWWDL